MQDKNSIDKLIDSMNEVVISLTTLLNELDKEVNKKIEEVKDINA